MCSFHYSLISCLCLCNLHWLLCLVNQKAASWLVQWIDTNSWYCCWQTRNAWNIFCTVSVLKICQHRYHWIKTWNPEHPGVVRWIQSVTANIVINVIESTELSDLFNYIFLSVRNNWKRMEVNWIVGWVRTTLGHKWPWTTLNCRSSSSTSYSLATVAYDALSPNRPGADDFYNTNSLGAFVMASSIQVSLRGHYFKDLLDIRHQYFALFEITATGR